MNRVITHISSLFVLSIFLVVAIATPLQAQNPVGYWRLDEGSGTTAADSSGNGHTAFLSSGIRWSRGTNGGAISANTLNRDSVSIPEIDLSGTRAVTIAFWTKRVYSTLGGNVLLEATGNYQDSTTGFALLPDDDTCHGIQAALRGNEGTTANCYVQPSSGVWHHLAIVYDKSQTGGNAVAFYVDGIFQSPNWSLSASTNTNSFGNEPVYLFSRAGKSKFSSGEVNELRLYSQALTPAEIQQIYNGMELGLSSPSGLVAAYAFNEGSGSTVTDASGNGNNGTISNATWTTAGRYGDALVFNGMNSTVTVNDAASLHLTSAMTIEAWVNSTFLTSTFRDVIAKGNDNYHLEASSTRNGHPAGGATIGPLDVIAYGTTVLSLRTWTHLAVTYDGTALRLYVNGVLESTLPDRGTISTSTNPLQIGGDSIYGRYFAGTIDEIRIYNTALAQSQIQSDMSTPIGFTMAASPGSLSVAQGNQGTSTITTTISGGFNSSIILSASGVPSGTTVSFSPNPISLPGSGNSTMMIAVRSSTPTGTYPITVTGNGGGNQQYTTVILTVTPLPSFTISASPTALSVMQGNQGISTITTALSGGFNNAISLSASGVPSGTTVSFSPNPIPAPGSGSSTMMIAVGSSTSTGTYPITVTGTGGGTQQYTTVTLTVTLLPSFTISASPAALSVMQGNQGTSTITTVISGGFNSSINLSATGLPAGTTGSFSPNPIPAPGGGSSVMTISVGSATQMGTYPITVTGSGNGTYQSVMVTLTVTAQVALSWTASQSPGIAGYNIYRSVTSGGPYTRMNSSLDSNTSYNDQAVQDGYTYYYVTTAVDSQGNESSYSNEAFATIQ